MVICLYPLSRAAIATSSESVTSKPSPTIRSTGGGAQSTSPPLSTHASASPSPSASASFNTFVNCAPVGGLERGHGKNDPDPLQIRRFCS